MNDIIKYQINILLILSSLN